MNFETVAALKECAIATVVKEVGAQKLDISGKEICARIDQVFAELIINAAAGINFRDNLGLSHEDAYNVSVKIKRYFESAE
jgi:hypothetical protein